jgi:hypothetical protein
MENLIGPQMGFVAQEVEAVFPEWVTTAQNSPGDFGPAAPARMTAY